MPSEAGRGAQVLLDEDARKAARGATGGRLMDNLLAKRAAEVSGAAATGDKPDGSTTTGAPADDVVIATSGLPLTDPAVAALFTAHTGSTSNPHGTTAAQVGAYTIAAVDTLLASAATARASGDSTNASAISAHVARTDNPHSVTAAQLGVLGKAVLPINVKDRGAAGNGVTDDGAIINAAIIAAQATGQAVYFPAGTYITSQTIILYAKTVLIGDNPNTTIIKLANGAQVNLLETYKFATFTGGTVTSPTDDADMTWGFAIRSLRFDGNRANNWSGTAPSSATGYGLRLYGRRYIIENVYIQNCAGIGFYSELGSGTTNSGPEDNKAGHIFGLDISRTSYEGFVFRGPSDIKIDDVVVGDAGGYVNTGSDPAGSSLLFSGKSIDGVVFDGGAAEVGMLHSHSAKRGFPVRLKDVRVRADNLTAEGGIGCVLVEGSTWGQINKLNTRNNQYGPGGSGTPADIRFAGSAYAQLTVTEIECRRSSNHKLGNAVEIAQAVQIGHIKLLGNSFAGHGVVVESGGSESQIGQIHASFLRGTAADGLASRALWTQASVAILEVANLFTRDCDYGWFNESTGRIMVANAYLRVSPTSFATNVAPADLTISPTKSVLRRCHIITNVDGTVKQAQFSGEAALDATITTEQTFTLAHNLWRQPDKAEVYLRLFHSGTPRPVPAYFYITAVDATNISGAVKLSSAGSGTLIALVSA